MYTYFMFVFPGFEPLASWSLPTLSYESISLLTWVIHGHADEHNTLLNACKNNGMSTPAGHITLLNACKNNGMPTPAGQSSINTTNAVAYIMCYFTL